MVDYRKFYKPKDTNLIPIPSYVLCRKKSKSKKEYLEEYKALIQKLGYAHFDE